MAKSSIERIREAEEQAHEQAEVIYAESVEGAKQAAGETLMAAREDGEEQSAAHARTSGEECKRLLAEAQKKRAAALEAVLRCITEE